MDSETKSKLLSPALDNHVYASPRYFSNGIGYCSLSEAACATVLELYVSGFQIRLGSTFQVPIGNGRSVDFLVNGVLFEFHKLRFLGDKRKHGDFRNRRAYLDFLRELYRVRRNRYKRDRLIGDTAIELRASYFERRRKLIDGNDHFRDTELVVAHDVTDLHDKIIRRFNKHHYPTCDELHELFDRLIRKIAHQNRNQDRGKHAA